MQGVPVRSPIRELRSHKPQGTAKTNTCDHSLWKQHVTIHNEKTCDHSLWKKHVTIHYGNAKHVTIHYGNAKHVTIHYGNAKHVGAERRV